jgi:ribonuclease T1
MIPLTSGRFITIALLVSCLFSLSACEEKQAKDPTLQQPVVTVPTQEETVPAQEILLPEEATPQEEVIPQEEATPPEETIVPTQETVLQEETVFVHQLSHEAQHTLVLIYQNGPFPYDRDGIVFGNREKLLPMERSGYYREYTVPTPGAKNRGARRIVCGGEKPSSPDRCYYTADHYLSFQLILDEAAKPDETTKP